MILRSWCLLILISALPLGTFNFSVFRGTVTEVNVPEQSFRLYTLNDEYMWFQVSENTIFTGIASLEELRPGTSVEIEAKQEPAAQGPWRAFSVRLSKIVTADAGSYF